MLLQLYNQLDKAPSGGLIVLPEYSSAGGLCDIESELKALPRAEVMLEKASLVARSSYSIDSDECGGCSMIVAPDGKIIKDMGKAVGSISAEIEPLEKYMRTAGFVGDVVRNDDFISSGLCPDKFIKE